MKWDCVRLSHSRYRSLNKLIWQMVNLSTTAVLVCTSSVQFHFCLLSREREKGRKKSGLGCQQRCSLTPSVKQDVTHRPLLEELYKYCAGEDKRLRSLSAHVSSQTLRLLVPGPVSFGVHKLWVSAREAQNRAGWEWNHSDQRMFH